MAESLTALLQIISSNVQRLESEYSKKGSPFPSLNDLHNPGPLDENPVALEASSQIVAAASQLIASVRTPELTIREYAPAMYMSACLGYVVENNIPEILKEAGEKGLHSKEVDVKIGHPNSAQSGRILRYLAMRHVFREVSPDVFTHNKVSSGLIKEGDRSVAELQADPEHMYDRVGNASFVGHTTDEGLKSAPYIIDFLKNPQQGSDSPFNMAFNTKSSIWEWFEQPGNGLRQRRFGAIMARDGSKMFRDAIFTGAFDWATLGPQDVVVDIGANVGTLAQTIARHFSKPQFVVQDLGKVIPQAKQFWESTMPAAVSEGRVKFQEYSFFTPQTVKGAAVYLLRFILHDWAEPECTKILQNVRQAAAPHSKLILFEHLVPYACEDTLNPRIDDGKKPLPAPLVPNSDTGVFTTMVDIQMMNLTGGQERTLGAFIELGKATGWKFETVKYDTVCAVIFTPA